MNKIKFYIEKHPDVFSILLLAKFSYFLIKPSKLANVIT